MPLAQIITTLIGFSVPPQVGAHAGSGHGGDDFSRRYTDTGSYRHFGIEHIESQIRLTTDQGSKLPFENRDFLGAVKTMDTKRLKSIDWFCHHPALAIKSVNKPACGSPFCQTHYRAGLFPAWRPSAVPPANFDDTDHQGPGTHCHQPICIFIH